MWEGLTNTGRHKDANCKTAELLAQVVIYRLPMGPIHSQPFHIHSVPPHAHLHHATTLPRPYPQPYSLFSDPHPVGLNSETNNVNPSTHSRGTNSRMADKSRNAASVRCKKTLYKLRSGSDDQQERQTCRRHIVVSELLIMNHPTNNDPMMCNGKKE